VGSVLGGHNPQVFHLPNALSDEIIERFFFFDRDIILHAVTVYIHVFCVGDGQSLLS
jgi:hypothetical protein